MGALDGIDARLERAKENIVNLEREIDSFLGEGLNATVANENPELLEAFIKYHSARIVPKRFGVLAGEIIHHLRSCLDHVVWQLVMANGCTPTKQTAFPIFAKRPTKKDEAARYNGQIERVSPFAKTYVNLLQPYNRGGDLWRDDWLWIVHDMDRIDKHRELIVIFITMRRVAQFWPEGIGRGRPFITCRSTNAAEELKPYFGPERQMNVHEQVTGQIAFRKFGKRENQPVIPSLSELLNFTRCTVNLFRRELL